jgi:hypothetical protein
MSKPEKSHTSLQDGVIGISWEYRCGFSSETNFERLYKAVINGVTVWKNATRTKVTFSIGEKLMKYQSEQELIKALENGKD